MQTIQDEAFVFYFPYHFQDNIIYPVYNEFFWMSKDRITELVGQYSGTVYDEIYQDLKHTQDRYVHELLKTTTLSEPAQLVLDKMTELVEATMEFRDIEHNTVHYSNKKDRDGNKIELDWHLNTWDAGLYQIKLIAKIHCPELLNEFNDAYKALGNFLRPGVMKFGFLPYNIQLNELGKELYPELAELYDRP